MGRIRHSLVDDDAEQNPAAANEPTRRHHWRSDIWVLLIVLAVGVIIAFVLSDGGNALTAASGRAGRTVASAPASATTPALRSGSPCTLSSVAAPSGSAAGALPAPGADGLAAVTTSNYLMDQPNVGLMQGSVDSQGNVWFGEMNVNKLVRLDPRTGSLLVCSPLNGKSGIMQTVVDRQGNVWYTEQNAGYIGKFVPTSQTFTTYPLRQVGGHSAGPQDLAFDPAGKLWFTEVSGNAIGRLDPATGTVTTFAAPLPTGGTSACPFSLAFSGGNVWYGDLCAGVVGRLDPATGSVKLFQPATPHAQIFSMAADSQGHIWFTELEQGKLGMITSATGAITEIPVPATLGQPTGLYAVTVTRNGDVWFAVASANALVRYVPRTGAFNFFTLSIPASVPYGLSVDSAGNLWFTADASPTNYVGMLRL
jgi:virginiamycin B lyase